MLSKIKKFFKGVGSVIKNFVVDHKDVLLELLQIAVAIALVVGLCYIAWPLLFPMMAGSFGMLFGSSTLGTLAALGLAGIMTAVATWGAVYMIKTKVVMTGFDWLGDKWRAHKSKDVVYPEENTAAKISTLTGSTRSPSAAHDKEEEEEEEEEQLHRRSPTAEPWNNSSSSSSSSRQSSFKVEELDDTAPSTSSPSSSQSKPIIEDLDITEPPNSSSTSTHSRGT